jgi:hypothetical protein
MPWLSLVDIGLLELGFDAVRTETSGLKVENGPGTGGSVFYYFNTGFRSEPAGHHPIDYHRRCNRRIIFLSRPLLTWGIIHEG